jgi:hypothetical protein
VYRVISKVKTYACKKAIRSSRNITAVTIAHGKTEIKIIREPDSNKVQEKPIKILSRACPDSMFANSRMLKLKTRATYETASINTKNGIIKSGAPDGKNKLFISHPCWFAAIVLIPIKCANEINSVKIKELVIVNEYGSKPIRLASSRVTKR